MPESEMEISYFGNNDFSFVTCIVVEEMRLGGRAEVRVRSAVRISSETIMQEVKI